jgi:nucleotide-binding universal stress UspA family protein
MNATIDSPIPRELPVSQRLLSKRRAKILVATDGSENSWSAYVAAELIGERFRTRVHVLSVLEPVPTIVPAPGAMIFSSGAETILSAETDRSREDALRTDMVEQLLKLGRLAKWTTEIRLGKPAAVIAEVAKEREVDLVIVGANHHGIVDRLMGEETAAHLARLVEAPLLVASPSIERLPKRALVALDLEPTDRKTLIRSLEILGSPESLSVIHVTPRSEALGVDWAEFDDEYRAEVASAYADIRAALGELPKIHPELVVVHGDVTREIGKLAESVKAELIVVGVKHRGPLSIAPGGIAMKVTRAASCSVLLIPGNR